MPETVPRLSPLAHVALQGRFGADRGAPGVELSVRHPMSIVMVIARSGRAGALAGALRNLTEATVHWAGPDQYYVMGMPFAEVKQKLGPLASCSDQSHGRVIIRIAGPQARRLLAKGTPVDLYADEFPIGKCALTQMAHAGVHLVRTGEDAFEVSVFRGFAESFWQWLTGQAEEFGFQVK